MQMTQVRDYVHVHRNKCKGMQLKVHPSKDTRECTQTEGAMTKTTVYKRVGHCWVWKCEKGCSTEANEGTC